MNNMMVVLSTLLQGTTTTRSTAVLGETRPNRAVCSCY